MRTPNFDNLLAVLHRDAPERPTLFEFFMNDRLCRQLVDIPISYADLPTILRWVIRFFQNAGYDYATFSGASFHFPQGDHAQMASRSANEGALIMDRVSFEAYAWPEPDACDYTALATIAHDLPSNMRLIIHGPNGVLENVINLTGFDNLCYLLMDDPDLVQAIFTEVGSRLVRHYEIAASYATVGAIISNDDWGFKTQTMLPPDMMRQYVFPWHRRIVEVAHGAKKPVILHSCGQLAEVMDDIIDMGYDAKHSYEDTICPVEEAYERWHDRIAILGGIDVDFLCRATPEEITSRSRAMLARTTTRGGYALGSGNSIPEYVPDAQYFSMTRAALEYA